MAISNTHKNFGEDWTCTVGDMPAERQDRQTDTHTHTHTLVAILRSRPYAD